MKIGNIDLGYRPVTLAPMEDVTDASFRILCREAGALCTDEILSEYLSLIILLSSIGLDL